MRVEAAGDLIIYPVVRWMANQSGKKFHGLDAIAMLGAIGLQESELTYKLQQGGPARGYWQFEQSGLDEARRLDRWGFLRELMRDPNNVEELARNDAAACCAARLLLWGHPDALPTWDQEDVGWNQYLARWRPGKPRREHWTQNWRDGWKAAWKIMKDHQASMINW